MSSLDYTYAFRSIADGFNQVDIINHNKLSTKSLLVSIKDFALFYVSNRQLPAIVADLVDLACAIHVVDCTSLQKDDMPSRIHLTLPVRHSEILSKTSIHEKLQSVLDWYTGNQWSITFTNYTKRGRTPELQNFLIKNQEHPTTVALWSGGLDALAGLYHQLRNDSISHYTLLGAGNNNIIFSTQTKVAKRIQEKFPNRTQLIQLPIRLNQSKTVTKNFNQRARGLVFILLGIACSYQLAQNTLHLYENGIGAMNLPFTKAEVGLDHSRSVHPLSLHYISDLIHDILGEPFSIYNPFLFSTKAQMCSLLQQHAQTDLIFQTITCDRRHRKEVAQCGYCSSCLLRRQALAAQGIGDQTRYVSTELFNKQQIIPDATYYNAMLFQVEDLRTLLQQPNPWQCLSKNYSYLQETIDRICGGDEAAKESMKIKFLHMYEHYIHEWDIAKPIIGFEFLNVEGTASASRSAKGVMNGQKYTRFN